MHLEIHAGLRWRSGEAQKAGTAGDLLDHAETHHADSRGAARR